MTHRISARLHASLLLFAAAIAARLRSAPQAGQGTVEYVALLLLVAGVLAAAVAVAGKGSFDLEKVITGELKQAIGKVSK